MESFNYLRYFAYMKNMQRLIVLFALVLFAPFAAFAQNGSQNVQIEILSQKESVSAGSTFYVALKQTIKPEWHTYWRNPGDVGDATRIEWSAPKGVEIGPINWPVPKKLPYADFINYGYDNEVIFPIQVKIAPNVTGAQKISASVSWLECKDVCVPGEGKLEFTIDVSKDKDSSNRPIIDKALNELPKPMKNYSANWVKVENKFHLGLVTSEKMNLKSAYFFPYEVENGALIDHAKPQTLTYGVGGFGLFIEPSLSLPDKLPQIIAGVIEINTDKGVQYFEIKANPANAASPKTIGSSGSNNTEIAKLIAIIGAAVLGGIILNFMPCVFPVLAMKILGLTKIAHGHEREAREYGNFYALGILTTFLVLGGILFFLKSLGAATGWGFQLQDPSFLVFMIVVLVLLGLNLLGLFEIGVGLQSIGANLAGKTGREGAFFSGALAVLVASPCTAPFMGSALGYAITQKPYIGLLVFLGLGFGMALPFLILTYFPSLLAKLPKPGLWMDTLKKALSIPMFLTALWLVWVLGSVSSIISLALAIIIASIGIWLTLLVIKNRLPAYVSIVAAVFSLIAAMMVSRSDISIKTSQYVLEDGQTRKNMTNSWSDERVQKELAAGRKVFVNFTADWCITCKVNEAAVFEKDLIKAEMNKNNYVYLVADWTRKDDKIARALSSHGRVGVPLYLIYDSVGAKPRVLPQLLSPALVIKELRK